jgi:hypothetical protein
MGFDYGAIAREAERAEAERKDRQQVAQNDAVALMSSETRSNAPHHIDLANDGDIELFAYAPLTQWGSDD